MLDAISLQPKIPKLTTLEIDLLEVTEAEFRQYAENNVITHASIVQTDEGFILVIKISWKEGDHTLHTFKKRPRAWVSLDRMIKFLREKNLSIPSVTLKLL